MKINYLLSLFTLFTLSTFAQTSSIAYPTVGSGVATTFVTDYHCLGINVSALGWGTGYEGKKFTSGSSEFSFNLYSDNLTSQKLKNLSSAIRTSFINKSTSNLDFNAQRQAAADYAQSGIGLNVDYNWAGFAYQGKRFGGIAFNINESYSFYSKFSQSTADIIFRGQFASYFDSLKIVLNGDTTMVANNPNMSPDSLAHAIGGTATVPLHLSQITNGTQIMMLWNRSYNLGYGRKIIGDDSTFAIYGGIGARFIQSMAMFNFNSNQQGMNFYSAITPTFNINYGNVANANPSNYTNVSGLLPKPVGLGYGLDFAASVVVLAKIKASIAVNNIGQVTYTRNVYSIKDSLVGNVSLAGLTNYNVTQSVGQLLSTNGLMQLKGKESYTVANPSNIRIGASIDFTKWLKVGIDMVAPFNRTNPGSIQNPVYSIGGNIKLFKRIILSCGYFGGGVYKSNIPVGINIVSKSGAHEFGIASRDALRFFNSNSHSISLAFGFARFRF